MLRLSVIASFIVLGCGQTGAVQEVTTNELTGLWYDVCVIHDMIISPYPVTCEWHNVTREDGGRVNEDFTFIYKGMVVSMSGAVTVADSIMAIKYADGEGGTLVYFIKSYDDGNDLILIDMHETSSSVLISRTREASEEATAEFKNLAADIGGYVHSIGNLNCF